MPKEGDLGPKMGPKSEKKSQKRVTFGTPVLRCFGRGNDLFGGKKEPFLDHFLSPFWALWAQIWALAPITWPGVAQKGVPK